MIVQSQRLLIGIPSHELPGYDRKRIWQRITIRNPKSAI